MNTRRLSCSDFRDRVLVTICATRQPASPTAAGRRRRDGMKWTDGCIRSQTRFRASVNRAVKTALMIYTHLSRRLSAESRSSSSLLVTRGTSTSCRRRAAVQGGQQADVENSPQLLSYPSVLSGVRSWCKGDIAKKRLRAPLPAHKCQPPAASGHPR